MDDDFSPKNPLIFNCKICYYMTSNKKDFNKHLTTRKHQKMTLGLQNDDEFSQKNPYKCECGGKYKYRQGLWRHKKICYFKKSSKHFNDDSEDDSSEIKILTELIKDVVKQNSDVMKCTTDVMKQNNNVMKQNQELTNKIIDICSQPNTISNSNIHSNNKTFNLQFFLNDTCKDAMNMSDFVNQVKISIKDLEETGEIGYTEGITNIIIKNLNDIDYTDRPIHCSDSKRETLYIKEDNQWFKDDETNAKISKAIKQIAHKNIKQIPEWVKLHPDCYDSESKKNDKYLKIVSNSMSGGTEIEQKTNISKIISKVAKEVTINKYFTS